MSTDRQWWVPLVAILLVAGGCGGDAGQDGGDQAAETSGQTAGSEQASEATAAQADQPETIGDLFPEGEGRTLVLNNCASCHAVACAAMGQRSPARWSSIEESHREHVPSLSDQELETIFSYLQEHFDDTQPEPEIPAAFLQRGCTPF